MSKHRKPRFELVLGDTPTGMDVTETCPNCDGRGSMVAKCCPEPEPCHYRGASLPCDECGGGGRVAESSASLPGIGEECLACEGVGMVSVGEPLSDSLAECEACGGTGREP